MQHTQIQWMVVAGSAGARREMASQSCSTHRYSGWWWLAVVVRAERWLVNHAAHTDTVDGGGWQWWCAQRDG